MKASMLTSNDGSAGAPAYRGRRNPERRAWMRLERKRGRPAGFALPKNAAIARSKSRSACCWSIVLRHVDALHEGTPAGVLSAARQVGGHRGWPSSASCSTECSAPAPSRTPSRSASSQLASYQLASLTVVTAALVQLLPSDSARLSLASRIGRGRLRGCRGGVGYGHGS